MNDDIAASRRDLVARVATLELLVSDLIDLLWKVDAEGMERLAAEAAQDLEIQNSRVLGAAEHQRERLFTVLAERKRKLKHRRRGAREDEPQAIPA
ncbi:hypothetical protein [Phenylobacterium sp. J367]|uniref:hypothetical protein n=1 Tax=Phenylobacterium sp. J367 TaxID=2898435 RepID=UPI00215185D9|nr:hypothetical protein [Phenylobacterium sp. J367]MCR5879110.1 hypothetical protein [Phenylobacterium sp. J367]